MRAVCSFVSDQVRPIGACLSLGLVWLFDVFTVHGLLVALGVESGADLTAPWATRIVWWALFYLAATGWVSRLMWREAVLSFVSYRQMWAAAHVNWAKRLRRRVVWWAGGITAGWKQFRAHGTPMPWWRRVVGHPVPATVPDTVRPMSEPVWDHVPAAA